MTDPTMRWQIICKIDRVLNLVVISINPLLKIWYRQNDVNTVLRPENNKRHIIMRKKSMSYSNDEIIDKTQNKIKLN